jgi:hypothetical protein
MVLLEKPSLLSLVNCRLAIHSDSLWYEFTLFGGKVEGDGYSDILWTHVSLLSLEITALRQTGPFRLLLRTLVEAGRGKLKWSAWVGSSGPWTARGRGCPLARPP